MKASEECSFGIGLIYSELNVAGRTVHHTECSKGAWNTKVSNATTKSDNFSVDWVIYGVRKLTKLENIPAYT